MRYPDIVWLKSVQAGVFILTWIVALTSFDLAFAQNQTKRQAALLNKVSQLSNVNQSTQQRIPIIVRFKSSFKRSEMLAKSQFEAHGKFNSIDFQLQKVRLFKYEPMASMSVDVNELKDLLADPELDVFEDSIKFPLLDQSVPAVYPTRNSSGFHGNNEWVVAILDSGIEKSHSFLGNKVVSEACFSDGGGQIGSGSLCPGGAISSLATGSGVSCSVQGCQHGTQVAGIAAGNGTSFDGVARDAKLISIQIYSEFNDESICGLGITSCIGAYTSDIIAGLERVFDLRASFKIAAVNLSLGSSELFSGSCDEQPEANIIAQLKSAGIGVVAATGNAANTSQVQSPACISDAIAVAASSNDGSTAWVGNNISSQLDLFAPGIGITSSTANNGFVADTGTSLAAPHVSGALAVMKHASPSLSVSQAESLLKSNGPSLTQHTVTRRRLALSDVLVDIGSLTPVANPADELCFPIKLINGSVSIICL